MFVKYLFFFNFIPMFALNYLSLLFSTTELHTSAKIKIRNSYIFYSNSNDINHYKIIVLISVAISKIFKKIKDDARYVD